MLYVLHLLVVAAIGEARMGILVARRGTYIANITVLWIAGAAPVRALLVIVIVLLHLVLMLLERLLDELVLQDATVLSVSGSLCAEGLADARVLGHTLKVVLRLALHDCSLAPLIRIKATQYNND